MSVQNIGLRGGTVFACMVARHRRSVLPPVTFDFDVIMWSRRGAYAIPCLIFLGGLWLRGFLAGAVPGETGGVSYRGYQFWIYYPTWTRLDPLVFGVVLAAIERCRPSWWQRLLISLLGCGSGPGNHSVRS